MNQVSNYCPRPVIHHDGSFVSVWRATTVPCSFGSPPAGALEGWGGEAPGKVTGPLDLELREFQCLLFLNLHFHTGLAIKRLPSSCLFHSIATRPFYCLSGAIEGFRQQSSAEVRGCCVFYATGAPQNIQLLTCKIIENKPLMFCNG